MFLPAILSLARLAPAQISIVKCDLFPAQQQWTTTPWNGGQGGNVQLCETSSPTADCFFCGDDCVHKAVPIELAAFESGSTYNAWLPKPLPGGAAKIQLVAFNTNAKQQSLCLQAPLATAYGTTNMGVVPCDATAATQSFTWNNATGHLSLASDAMLCVTHRVALGPGACDGAQSGSPWCDTTTPFTSRAAALVSALTVAEKSHMFVNAVPATPRLDLPAYNWWSEALHGVARDGVATSFPQICGVAASLNKSLWTMVGNVTSTEARGLNNGAMSSNSAGELYHGLTMWAPNVNIFRDPRWGRGQETPGEDPQINSDYASLFIPAMQGHIGTAKPPAGTTYKTMACLKHYAAYSQETGRETIGVHVTSQDMIDTYLPAFEAGVVEGGAKGLMCSYNAETYGSGIFGAGTQGGAIPSCANKGLMQDLVRAKWGFDGYITSDCGAVNDVQNAHQYTPNSTETISAVFEAGLDTDCGGFMNNGTMSSIAYGDENLSLSADRSLKRLFAIQMELGFFDKRSTLPAFGSYGIEVINTKAHQQLAKEAADQSMVLLKNDVATLPYDLAAMKASGKTIAVVGRNAEATNNMQGNYFGAAPFLISPCQGVNASVGAGGIMCDGSANDTTATLAAIKAGTVGAVIIVAGLTSEGAPGFHDEAEGHDRTTLILPLGQDAYITAIAAAAGAATPKIPVTLVLMGGSAMDVSMHKSDVNVGAIMWCGYPGQSGGASIADTVFGINNPSGRLTVTWYPQHFADTVALSDYSMRPNVTSGNPGRSHRFYTGTPVFAFGTGLSFTKFSATSPAVTMVNKPLTTARQEALEGMCVYG